MNLTGRLFDDLVSAQDCEVGNYGFIDTIRYDREIAKICAHIRTRIKLDYISCCLTFPNGTKCVLSNNPGKIAIPYQVHGLHRLDNSFFAERYREVKTKSFKTIDLPNDPLGQFFEKILLEKYRVANAAGLTRSFQGYLLIVIFGLNANQVGSNPSLPRDEELNHYVIDFFDQIIPIYAQEKPQLRYSRFFMDRQFRQKFIKGELEESDVRLKDRELQCLYWARMGKTAEEIALILGISRSTTRGHLENIREKFDVASIQEAIVMAIHKKLIG